MRANDSINIATNEDTFQDTLRDFITSKISSPPAADTPVHTYHSMDDVGIAFETLQDLAIYQKNISSNKHIDFDHKLVALFPGTNITQPTHFETAVWQHLKLLHYLHTGAWGGPVSKDATSDTFCIHLSDQPLYVTALHPHSKDHARQAPCSMLIYSAQPPAEVAVPAPQGSQNQNISDMSVCAYHAQAS